MDAAAHGGDELLAVGQISQGQERGQHGRHGQDLREAKGDERQQVFRRELEGNFSGDEIVEAFHEVRHQDEDHQGAGAREERAYERRQEISRETPHVAVLRRYKYAPAAKHTALAAHRDGRAGKASFWARLSPMINKR